MITIIGKDLNDVLDQLGFEDDDTITDDASRSRLKEIYDEAANSPMAPDQRQLMFVLYHKISPYQVRANPDWGADRHAMSERILGRRVSTWADRHWDPNSLTVADASKIIDALRTTCVVLGLEEGPL